jgi:hypothetical protein
MAALRQEIAADFATVRRLIGKGGDNLSLNNLGLRFPW